MHEFCYSINYFNIVPNIASNAVYSLNLRKMKDTMLRTNLMNIVL